MADIPKLELRMYGKLKCESFEVPVREKCVQNVWGGGTKCAKSAVFDDFGR